MRLGAEIEMTTSGGGAFEKFQVLIRIVTRADFTVLRGEAFQHVSGITT
jgi:hypothetical protein